MSNCFMSPGAGSSTGIGSTVTPCHIRLCGRGDEEAPRIWLLLG